MIVPYAGKPGSCKEYVKLYRKVWAESGHEPGAEQIQVAQFCYVAEKSDEAHAGFERICKRYLETFADAVVSWKGAQRGGVPGLRQDGGQHPRHHARRRSSRRAAPSSARPTR